MCRLKLCLMRRSRGDGLDAVAPRADRVLSLFRRFAVTALGEPPAVATTAGDDWSRIVPRPATCVRFAALVGSLFAHSPAREREPGSTRQAEPDAVFQSSSSTQSRVLVTALRQRA